MKTVLFRRAVCALVLFGAVTATFGSVWGAAGAAPGVRQATPIVSCAGATPAATMTDETAGMAMGTPPGGEGSMAGMEMGSPMAGMATEFDQLYIDMMIPHHASIVAMAQAALGRLENERLVAIAETIVAAQAAEIEELRSYRERFYGDPEPMVMDERMMGMMDQAMPGMAGSMDEMATQMDPAAQVAALCAAADADLAFIDLTIPHHESAIAASEAAVTDAAHEEIRAFARRVIDDQQREIEELEAIRAELSDQGTPASS